MNEKQFSLKDLGNLVYNLVETQRKSPEMFKECPGCGENFKSQLDYINKTQLILSKSKKPESIMYGDVGDNVMIMHTRNHGSCGTGGISLMIDKKDINPIKILDFIDLMKVRYNLIMDEEMDGEMDGEMEGDAGEDINVAASEHAFKFYEHYLKHRK